MMGVVFVLEMTKIRPSDPQTQITPPDPQGQLAPLTGGFSFLFPLC